MKIKTKETILDLASKPLAYEGAHLTVGKVIAQSLLAPRKQGDYLFDKVKLLILAQEFYKENEVEMDAAELEKLLKIMETDEAWAPLITGRVILALRAVK